MCIRDRFYPGMRRLSENTTINIKNKSWTVTAQANVPDEGAELSLIHISEPTRLNGESRMTTNS